MSALDSLHSEGWVQDVVQEKLQFAIESTLYFVRQRFIIFSESPGELIAFDNCYHFNHLRPSSAVLNSLET